MTDPSHTHTATHDSTIIACTCPHTSRSFRASPRVPSPPRDRPPYHTHTDAQTHRHTDTPLLDNSAHPQVAGPLLPALLRRRTAGAVRPLNTATLRARRVSSSQLLTNERKTTEQLGTRARDHAQRLAPASPLRQAATPTTDAWSPRPPQSPRSRKALVARVQSLSSLFCISTPSRDDDVIDAHRHTPDGNADRRGGALAARRACLGRMGCCRRC
jgi:hypothetical protein